MESSHSVQGNNEVSSEVEQRPSARDLSAKPLNADAKPFHSQLQTVQPGSQRLSFSNPASNVQPGVNETHKPHTTGNLASPAPVSLSDLATLVTLGRRDPLPEWKLDKFDGNPLDWHEWFGQFVSTVDSAQLSDDIKLKYLKTLVTGKAKTAIAEFSYCGKMYVEALQTLERKFGQLQVVVDSHLEKLRRHPSVKMHNSESSIDFAQLVASLVGVFRSLGYEYDLNAASLLNEVISKLPPNLREAWSLHTVKAHLFQPTLIHLNRWLQERAEAHDRMQSATSFGKTKTDSQTVKTKGSTSKSFSSASRDKTKAMGDSACPMCKQRHKLYQCSTFKTKRPTDRAKFAADKKSALVVSTLSMCPEIAQRPQVWSGRLQECTSFALAWG